MHTPAISVRRAAPADAPALAELINRAYAIESFFVDGTRTTVGEVEALITRGTFLVLEDTSAPGELAAAVYVEPTGTLSPSQATARLGMLSVLPELQGHGLGTRLVRIVEALCEAAGCTAVTLRIVNLREELARWYRSLGYRECGTSPFDHPSVKRPCHFVEMRKDLRPVTAAAA